MKTSEFALCVFLFFNREPTGTFQYDGELLRSLGDTVIYEDGRFGTMEIFSSLFLGHSSVEEFAAKYPRIVYKTLQCKYAFIVVQSIQSFYDIYAFASDQYVGSHTPRYEHKLMKWLKKSTERLCELGPYVSRMIHALFDLSDRSDHSKTTDRRFVKSLLAIGLFLDYGKKRAPYIVYDSNGKKSWKNPDKTMAALRVLGNTLLQIVRMVDLFRCANCGVEDPFASYEKREGLLTTKSAWNGEFRVWESLRGELQVLTDVGDVDYPADGGFDVAVLYDPGNVLLEFLLRYNGGLLGNATIEFGGERTELKNAFAGLTESYNVGDAFEYQTCLVRVVADVFHRRISDAMFESAKINVDGLRELRSNFNAFVATMIPINCLRGAFRKTLKIKSLLDEAPRDFGVDDAKSRTFRPLKKMLRSAIDSGIVYTDFDEDVMDDPTLILFATLVAEKKHACVAFKRVMSVLSYESQLNDDFRISGIQDRRDKIYDKHGTHKFLNNATYVRTSLTPLMLIVSKKTATFFDRLIAEKSSILDGSAEPGSDEKENADFGVLLSLVAKFLVKIYENFTNNNDIDNLMAPLLIHFDYLMEKHCFMTELDYQILFQMLLSTISAIEYNLLKNYKWPVTYMLVYYNLDPNSVASNKTALLDSMKHVLADEPETAVLYGHGTRKCIFDTYNKFVYKTDFRQKDDQIQLYWKGIPKYGNDLMNDMLPGIIDQYDLVSYQWFFAKWCLCKILIHVKYALELFKENLGKPNPKRMNINYPKNKMSSEVKKLKKIKFKKSIRGLIDDTIVAVLNVVAASRKPYAEFNATYKHSVRSIDDNLVALGALEKNVSYKKNYDDIFSSISKYVDELKECCNDKKKNPIFCDTILSPKENTYSKKCIPID